MTFILKEYPFVFQYLTDAMAPHAEHWKIVADAQRNGLLFSIGPLQRSCIANHQGGREFIVSLAQSESENLAGSISLIARCLKALRTGDVFAYEHSLEFLGPAGKMLSTETIEDINILPLFETKGPKTQTSISVFAAISSEDCHPVQDQDRPT